MTNAERIALIVELATVDAKNNLARELASYNAKLALNNAFGNNRRWRVFAELLANSARAYIDDLATRLREIDTGDQASIAYSDAVENLLTHLGRKYESEWAKTAPWRNDKGAPPPPAWQSAKGHLVLAFRVQESEFSDGEQSTRPSSGRAPSVKAGRPPADDKILAKADEMKARGLDGRKIAGQMRHESGFENVATTDVRELIKGRWKPSGRPKQKDA